MIALAQIDLLDTVAALFSACLIPPAVARETARSVVRPTWIHLATLTRPIDARIVQENLGDGEAEAIALALELGSHVVVVDDRRGRRVATAFGLGVIGTIRLVVEAKRAGLVPAVRPHLDGLLATGFFASPSLIANALADVGE